MTRIKTVLAATLTALLCAVLIQPALAESDMQSFVGTVNKDARFETPEGDEYLIVGEIAQEVVAKQGEKLKVSGELRTEGDGKVIAVKEYKVLDDYEFQQELEKQQMKKE